MFFVRGWSRRRAGSGLVAIGLATTMIVGSVAPGVCAERGVMLDVIDAKLSTVALMLTNESGANIIISPEVADKNVTAHISDLPLEKVLEYVANTAQVDFWKTEDGTYIVGGKKPQNVQTPVAQPVAQPVEVARPVQKLSTVRVKLVHSHPDDIMVATGLMDERNNRSTLAYLLKQPGSPKVIGTLDEGVDNTGIQFSGAPRTHHLINNVDVIDNSVAPAVDDPNGDGSANRSPSTKIGADQGYYSRGTAGSTYRPATGATTTTGTTTANGEGSLLPDGINMVMPFTSDNSLIVRGTDDGIAAFKELVHLLDISPKQVSIKAEFVEVSTADAKKFGVDWSLDRLNSNISTNFHQGGNVLIGFTTGNLSAAVAMELTKSAGEVINAPIISTLNNEPASIQIENEIPAWSSTLVNDGSGHVITSESYNPTQVRSQLMVLPRVNGDGTITLTLAPQISDSGQIHKSPLGQEQAETRTESLTTRRVVANGETIVVGGFIRRDNSNATSEVPLLGSLPIIGPLFKAKRQSGVNKELLIFVTPTIIGERASGTPVGITPTP